MLIAPEHYQQLQTKEPPDIAYRMRQMRSDFTIKAVGWRDALEKHKDEIVMFANSFELIEEIPTR